MMRKTSADLATLRADLAQRRRTAAYRATESHNAGLLAEMIEAHRAIVALDAVIAEGSDGMDVDTFDDTLAAWAALND